MFIHCFLPVDRLLFVSLCFHEFLNDLFAGHFISWIQRGCEWILPVQVVRRKCLQGCKFCLAVLPCSFRSVDALSTPTQALRRACPKSGFPMRRTFTATQLSLMVLESNHAAGAKQSSFAQYLLNSWWDTARSLWQALAVHLVMPWQCATVLRGPEAIAFAGGPICAWQHVVPKRNVMVCTGMCWCVLVRRT